MPSVNKLKLRDFDHGLAQSLGVVALFIPGGDGKSVFDLVTGTTYNFGTGATIVGTPEGPALHFDGSQAFNVDHPAIGGRSANNYLVCGRIRANLQQAGNPGAIFGVSAKTGTQTSFGIGWDNSATPKVGNTVLTGTLASSGNLLTTALNRFDTLFTHGDGGTATTRAFANGVLTSAASIFAGGSVNPNTISFGAQYRSSGFLRHAKGDLLWAAVILLKTSATFTAGDAWQIYANDFPHSLFRQSRRPWPAAAAGNTFSVAITESADSVAATLNVAAAAGGSSAHPYQPILTLGRMMGR